MASAAPGVRYPNVYGIDMPSATELIAHGRTDDEVGEIIGADWIIYQDLEDLISSAAEGNEDINRFECSVFDGNYITGDVDKTYLDRIEGLRNDAAKQKSDPSAKSKTGQVIGIHNNSVS
jgi:amidophosphoribosyltransferase